LQQGYWVSKENVNLFYTNGGYSMTMTYQTKGTCSRAINFEVEGDTIKSVEFVGGCQGNTKGVSKLVAGMKVDDVINRLDGVDCGGRGTSCPDQLARALKAYKEQYIS
jgi:uncharacterized protein (TIGR03905 family)